MLQELLDQFQQQPSLNPFDRSLLSSSRSLIEKSILEKNEEVLTDKSELRKLIIRLFTIYCYETKLNIFHQTYAGITTEGAKLLLPKPEPSENGNGVPWSAAVYVEVEFASFVNIMQRCCYASSTLSSNHSNCQEKRKIFVDLGHGLGKAMVATSLLFGPQFSHIYGIEYAPPLYEESIQRLNRYKELMTSSGYPVPHEMTAILDDFLQPAEANEGFDWTTAGKYHKQISFICS